MNFPLSPTAHRVTPRLSLDECYAVCQRISRRSGSSFIYSFALLPREQRRAMYALYAWLRQVDDMFDDPPRGATSSAIDKLGLVDRQVSTTQSADRLPELPDFCPKRGTTLSWLVAEQSPLTPPRLADLTGARDALESALRGENPDPVHRALAHTAQCYQIPVEYFLAVLRATAMDVTGRRYATWDELCEYLHGVAVVVGWMCLCIWRAHAPAALPSAAACGRAFQLTNILRDWHEDALLGRLYLPLEFFTQAGYDLQGNITEKAAALRALLRLGCDRAEQEFAEARSLLTHLDRPARKMYSAMHSSYAAILTKVRQGIATLRTEPVRLSRWDKLRIAARCWLWDQPHG
ncbi:MAG: phytoene/squalene synthase family protein [Pirellulales bacterium]|nr:phytoene/squalene synthase family protein [Pirellulales bacterium]